MYVAWIAYAVAAACGAFSAITFARSVYHQWAKRGTTSGLFANTVLSLASGFAALAAFILAAHLRRM